MKKRLIFYSMVFIGILGFVFLGFQAVHAAYLVCDPQAGVTEYELNIDGTILTGITAEADGSIHYAMDAWVGGTHNLLARCKNMWGWSVLTPDPFVFNADVPGAPSGFGFSVN